MKIRVLSLALAFLFALSATPVSYGELVAGGPGGPGGHFIIYLGIVEGADPIESVYWRPIADPTDALNPNGEHRDDGRPDIAFNPENQYPVVVWAYGVADDYDIALSQWDGFEWSEVEFLTSSVEKEIDPRVYVQEDGTLFVTWWVESIAGAGKVYLTRRGPTDIGWEYPQLVTDFGAKPSVISRGSDMLVAYERPINGPGNPVEVVLWTQTNTGSVTNESLHITEGPDPLEIVIHEQNGFLWIDWQDSANQFAYTIFRNGRFGPPMYIPWTNRSWLGQEEARQLVEQRVMASD